MKAYKKKKFPSQHHEVYVARELKHSTSIFSLPRKNEKFSHCFAHAKSQNGKMIFFL